MYHSLWKNSQEDTLDSVQHIFYCCHRSYRSPGLLSSQKSMHSTSNSSGKALPRRRPPLPPNRAWRPWHKRPPPRPKEQRLQPLPMWTAAVCAPPISWWAENTEFARSFYISVSRACLLLVNREYLKLRRTSHT